MKESLFAFLDLFINWRNIKEHTLIMLEINEDEILETVAVYIMEKRKNKALLITAYTLALICRGCLLGVARYYRSSFIGRSFVTALLYRLSYVGALLSGALLYVNADLRNSTAAYESCVREGNRRRGSVLVRARNNE